MKMKILLAEDDNSISKIMSLTLETMGQHEVTVAENGQLALNFALDTEFDLILLDQMMPEIDGLGVCAELQKKGEFATPIIFMSAKSQDSLDISATGAVGYIEKPFDPQSICQRIDEILISKEEEAS